jgi:hypothetical protein
MGSKKDKKVLVGQATAKFSQTVPLGVYISIYVYRN